jgi:UDP-2,3-diacylglucosamine pyrophosphatase LpxH
VKVAGSNPAGRTILNFMQKKKLYIISDLHIGGDEVIDNFKCTDELIEFLDYLENKDETCELLILGDFFDFWKFDKHKGEELEFVISVNQKLFDRFKKFGGKHKITAIPGNHDHALLYKPKFQEDLKKYNIDVETNQFFKREFKNGEKTFRIIGEHGNQVEPVCEIPDFNLPTDSSFSYHNYQIIVKKLMKLGTPKKKPVWLASLVDIDIELIPYWLLSKYFYYEFGPLVQVIVIPMLLMFSFLAIPYFIFDVFTHFYYPQYMSEFVLFLDTNPFCKAIAFILYFDMAIVLIVFIAAMMKGHFNARLREYGVHSLTEILLSRQHSYMQRAKAVVKGENPFKQKASLYVTGHTHLAGAHHYKETNYVDTGSWKQLMRRVAARFSFPPVFVPYYELTYVEVGIDIIGQPYAALRERPKQFEPKLTILESLALKRNGYLKKPIKKDRLIRKLKLDFV